MKFSNAHITTNDIFSYIALIIYISHCKLFMMLGILHKNHQWVLKSEDHVGIQKEKDSMQRMEITSTRQNKPSRDVIFFDSRKFNTDIFTRPSFSYFIFITHHSQHFYINLHITNNWIFILGACVQFALKLKIKFYERITLLGINNRLSPSQILPDSIFPITTVPMSLNLSIIGILEW